MPPKLREIIKLLKQAGFTDRGGKGSHRNFTHPNCPMPVTISGNPGDDAKPYQEKLVQKVIEESKR
ncbi:MAG: addiction module toxin, HicA family [Geobacter sp.]|jgi:predicted RNA binding protein YcfA (HicA-like mRNA interferase family)|nr:addiction module toxin, HicA family [Geobacter sp.]